MTKKKKLFDPSLTGDIQMGVNFTQAGKRYSDVDIMDAEYFLQCVACNGFTDWDGHGEAFDIKYLHLGHISPSTGLPDYAAWVVWYNK